MKNTKGHFTCKSCHYTFPRRHDCGGDCVYCMAEAGDPECLKSVLHKAREGAAIKPPLKKWATNTLLFRGKQKRSIEERVNLLMKELTTELTKLKISNAPL